MPERVDAAAAERKATVIVKHVTGEKTAACGDAEESGIFSETLSRDDFSRLSHAIQATCGIRMPATKKIMLEARLRKRLRSLGMKTFRQYCDYLFSPAGADSEFVHMIDVVTTNKTEFFREPAHFDFLARVALPDILRRRAGGNGAPLALWSAGCSTGEEPYSLAMALHEYMEPDGIEGFYIIATDISTAVIDKARAGIYEESRIEQIPMELRKKYLMRSRDKSRKLVRVVPELRRLVSFRRLNFMERDFGFREMMSIIFCRNVIIYFDRATQERLLMRFCRHLKPGGYLFMGHSETLHGMHLPLEALAPSIYRRRA